ncbi:hypothetical protein [Aureibacter tunicatorum]|uniref:Uncharacterized protein n=1 Tax=Aureibacter tunicatorum TaxID=866807 RepID=A0AAE3XKU3_9BACT|nr:hypothetical protein [Aureibacter tunicatorum]MDR6238727.1 hypothetical protein [Aureibacter tunicatorum]BDD05342.1 hypothetical protein AUTU_28250 [Aureibacter tunicatorum]
MERSLRFRLGKLSFNMAVALAIAFTHFSCSLLKVNLEGNSVPLTKKEQNIRISVREYADVYYQVTETVADSILSWSDEEKIQVNSILWKINANESVERATLMTDPNMSLLQTWLTVELIHDFMDGEVGQEYYGEYQYWTDSATSYLQNRLDSIVLGLYDNMEYEHAKQFIDTQKEDLKLEEFPFAIPSVRLLWLKYNNIPDSLATVAVGNLPEAINDLGDKVTTMSSQAAKRAIWKTELAYRSSGLDSLNINALKDSVTARIDSFIVLAKEAPELIDHVSESFRNDMFMLMDRLDFQMMGAFDRLEAQGKSFEKMISSEREKVMNDLKVISVDVTQTAISELRKTISSILLYVILGLVLIIVLPFGLGFATGRIFSSKKKGMDNSSRS